MTVKMNTRNIVLIGLLCVAFSATASNGQYSDRFGAGNLYASLQGGWGKGFSLGSLAGDGDGKNVEYVAILPQLGIGLSDVVGGTSWYRGNLDAVFEGEFLAGYEPNSGYSAGLSLLLRYNFLYSEQWVPYLELGGGIGYLDFDLRNQADGLIFYPQAGLGLHYFFTDNMSVDLGWRFHHMSNANTELPNNSINSSLLLFGFSWFFD
ncbi:MAG: acyloxyacyl hydrolase [Gammaproteobacteria bacterium]|nr:acyloxyacyl hydrolase [Gammaproteobacteria bacterium]